MGMCKSRGYQYTNECQFYITTAAPLTFLDNKYVVFGRVVQGMRVLKILEKSDCVNERPVVAAKITDCGVYSLKQDNSALAKKKMAVGAFKK